MMNPAVRELLTRVVLDEDFRAQVRDGLEEALSSYALSEQQKEALRAGDERLLALMGQAFLAAEGAVPSAESTASSAPALSKSPYEPPPVPAGDLPELAAFTLYLRLVPHASKREDGHMQLQHISSVSMTPVPAGAPVDNLPPDFPSSENILGVSLREASYAIAVRPLLSLQSDQTWQSGFQLEVTEVEAADPATASAPQSPISPNTPPPLTAADITIVGLGVMRIDQITREAERAIRQCAEVLYVDTTVATGAFLQELAPKATNLFAAAYRQAGERISAYQFMAQQVIEAAERGPVVFALPGHPSIFAMAPALVQEKAAAQGLTVRVLPGISALDTIVCDLNIDVGLQGLQMFEATDLLLRRRPLQADVPVLIWQVGNLGTRLYTSKSSSPERMQPLIEHLARFYPLSHQVTAVFSAPHPMMNPSILTFALSELGDYARQLHPGYSLFIPPAFERPIVDKEMAQTVDDPEHLRSLTGQS